jgi:hypothetical protein
VENRDKLENENVTTNKTPDIPHLMSIEELDAACDWQSSPDLTGALERVREGMIRQSESERASQERLRNSQATADFLRHPVICSSH